MWNQNLGTFSDDDDWPLEEEDDENEEDIEDEEDDENEEETGTDLDWKKQMLNDD